MATEQDLQLCQASVEKEPYLNGSFSTQASRTDKARVAETGDKLPGESMENADFPGNQPLIECSICGRHLPQKAFYRKPNGNYEKFCIECRCERNRRYRLLGKKRIDYPVITQVTDPIARMELILHAKTVVKERMRRQHERLEGEALEAFPIP